MEYFKVNINVVSMSGKIFFKTPEIFEFKEGKMIYDDNSKLELTGKEYKIDVEQLYENNRKYYLNCVKNEYENNLYWFNYEIYFNGIALNYAGKIIS